ncbi:MAG: hypothetical protein P9M12_03150 [Candidatus Aceula lacicola]|nr:hypothetical protein [Candidatus Aceula lacicola]
MKKAVAFLIIILGMAIFATIFFIRLDAWEKKIRTDVKQLARDTVAEMLLENINQ